MQTWGNRCSTWSVQNLRSGPCSVYASFPFLLVLPGDVCVQYKVRIMLTQERRYESKELPVFLFISNGSHSASYLRDFLWACFPHVWHMFRLVSLTRGNSSTCVWQWRRKMWLFLAWDGDISDNLLLVFIPLSINQLVPSYLLKLLQNLMKFAYKMP